MASAGFLMLPNDMSEILSIVGPAAYSIYEVIIKKTLGWRKTTEQITCTELQRATKQSRNTVIKWLKFLKKNFYIFVHSDDCYEVLDPQLKSRQANKKIISPIKLNNKHFKKSENSGEKHDKKLHESKTPRSKVVSKFESKFDTLTSPHSILQKKEKQQPRGAIAPVVVSLSSKKNQRHYPCLDALTDVPISVKNRVSRNFPEARVLEVVNWCLDPSTVFNKSISHALQWACSDPSFTPKQKPADRVGNNRQKAVDLLRNIRLKPDNLFFDMGTQYVEIGYSNSSHRVCIAYNEKSFEDQITNALRKHKVIFNL